MSTLAERFIGRSSSLEAPKYPFSVKEVVIAGDLGPCGGVKQAVQTTQEVLGIVNGRERVFANRKPVHNDLISEEFTKRGLIIQPDLDLLTSGDILILSAHGTPPSTTRSLRERGIYVVNTECQLVSMDRRAAERAVAGGNALLYVGVSGHPEPKAVTADLPQENVTFMDSISDAKKLQLPTDRPIKVISQTTISINGTKEKIEALRVLNPGADISDPIGDCDATDFRQDAALELLDPKRGIDFLIVVGSRGSHNTEELTNIGIRRLGDERARQIDRVDEIDTSWFLGVKRVGFTAGASVLDQYSEDVLRWFQQRGSNLTFLPGKEKDTIFKEPRADIEAVRQYIQQKYEN